MDPAHAQTDIAPNGTPLVFLIAGEPSGDLLGSRLMAALRSQTNGRVRFAGVGGDEMVREGLQSLFPISDLAVMGFLEVLPRAPRLLRRIRETATEIRRLRPDAVVTIDSPGFSFRVAKRVARQGIPLIHYVAPSVWAYAPGRAKKIARFLDHVLALLPFEPPYFEAEGLPCTYVGHPAVETTLQPGAGAKFRERHGIAPEIPVIAVLPGSRRSETRRLLPVFHDTLERLVEQIPNLQAVAPTVSTVADEVASAAERWPIPAVIIRDGAEKLAAFAASDVALAASGTVSVELASCGVPHAVAYRVNAPTSFVMRRILKIDYASLVNLVMDRDIVPEFIQEYCRSDYLADTIARLLTDPAARSIQRAEVEEAMRKLGKGQTKPSQRAAEVVLKIIAETAPARRINAEENNG